MNLESSIAAVTSIKGTHTCTALRLKLAHYFGRKCILVELFTVINALLSPSPTSHQINIQSASLRERDKNTWLGLITIQIKSDQQDQHHWSVTSRKTDRKGSQTNEHIHIISSSLFHFLLYLFIPSSNFCFWLHLILSTDIWTGSYAQRKLHLPYRDSVWNSVQLLLLFLLQNKMGGGLILLRAGKKNIGSV